MQNKIDIPDEAIKVGDPIPEYLKKRGTASNGKP